jgi:MarR family transcriptional regulator, organic hydroperoxide resistance regulator
MSPNTLKDMFTDRETRLRAIAEENFSLRLMFWAVRHRNRVEDPHELTDPEYFTLHMLSQKGVCTVGDLQKSLDVRPAQMSRIIRSLESKGKGLITCAINPKDKRKINVVISDAGRKAHDVYKNRHIEMNVELIRRLSDSEQEEMWRLMNRYRSMMAEMIEKNTEPKTDK